MAEPEDLAWEYEHDLLRGDWDKAKKRIAYRLADLLSFGDEQGFLAVYDAIPSTVTEQQVQSLKEETRRLIAAIGGRRSPLADAMLSSSLE